MRAWARRTLAVIVAVLALLASTIAINPLTTTADASVATATCARGDLVRVKTVSFKRDGKVLDYATMQVWRVPEGGGIYCMFVGSEYKRTVWLSGASCKYVTKTKKWNCQTGFDYVKLGTKYAFEEQVSVRKDTRQSFTFRLKTASGNYYYAKTGWLYYY